MAHRGPDWAIDTEGKSLPYSPDQVRQIVDRALTEGDLLAVVSRMPSGDLAVQVLGNPSHEVAEALMQARLAYKRALEGQ